MAKKIEMAAIAVFFTNVCTGKFKTSKSTKTVLVV